MAEGTEGSAAVALLAERHAARTAQLPEREEALWAWLLTQETATLINRLAYCAACTVKPQRDDSADHPAASLALDMAQRWKADAGFFGRMPKERILDAVTEGPGVPAVDNIAAMKNGAMAGQAATLLNDIGWLPALLRAA